MTLKESPALPDSGRLASADAEIAPSPTRSLRAAARSAYQGALRWICASVRQAHDLVEHAIHGARHQGDFVTACTLARAWVLP